MTNELLNINHNLMDEIAKKYFAKMCGVIDYPGQSIKKNIVENITTVKSENIRENNFENIIQTSINLREEIKNNIKVIVSSYGSDAIKENVILIGGKSFPCPVLKQIDHKHIIGIYAYMLTIGETNFSDMDVLDQFYADTWGTAYIDALRDVLQVTLKEKAKADFNIEKNVIAISDAFGPGYYGMDITSVSHFFSILDSNKIGVTLLKSGLMAPIKSNVGFFLVMDDKSELPRSDCKSCIGIDSGCNFCKASKRTLNSEVKGKDERMRVTFLPNNIEVLAKEDENILDIAVKAGIELDGNCNHSGRCGKCKVKITIGKASDIDETEKKALTDEELKKGFRLACKAYPRSDLRVFVTEINRQDKRKSRLINIPESLIPESLIPEILIPETLAQEGFKQENKYEEKKLSYGIAFDIGTTSVVALLWNLKKGELVDAEATVNPQRIYGADVISRITFCLDDSLHLKKMQELIIDGCNHLIKELCKKNTIPMEAIDGITVVGNTTMSHLFLGVEIKGLAKVPFKPAFNGAYKSKIQDLGLNGNKNAELYLLPGIAGHVGSDITAGILATNLTQKTGIIVMIDIGTNGEIVVSKNGKLFTCSTAAGPAFEGAGVKNGMRASAGAIEGVKIKDGEVFLTSIEDKQPIGICGSGLIDAIAELLNAGMIDETGRILDKKSAKENEVHQNLIPRIRENEMGVSFVLSFGENGFNDVVIMQDDVREVQLAKGAIQAGILTLLEKAEVKFEQIDRILIAGAFGNYIKKESALRIGLFNEFSTPNSEKSEIWKAEILKDEIQKDEIFKNKIQKADTPKDRIISIGNSAGIGASLALLSTKERKKAEELVKNISYIELAKEEMFKEKYIKSMNFPK